MHRILGPITLSLLAVISWQAEILSAAIEQTPLAAHSPQGSSFASLSSAESGIDFQAPLLPDHAQSYLYYSGFAAGSVCIGDVDGDGLPDVFFTSGPDDNALFLNNGGEKLSFRKADGAGVAGGTAWGAGSSLVDIDNDGDLDIYVCNYRSANQLFINETEKTGSPRFSERAADFGLDLVDSAITPSFADYDLDGDLDLYVLHNQSYRPGGRPTKPPFRMVNGKPVVLPEFEQYYRLQEKSPGNFAMDDYGRPDRFFRNDGPDAQGQIRFLDVTEQVGISGIGFGLSVTWWDYNDDGYPDLYIGNDFTDPDRLYRNQGDGTFQEVLGNTLPYCSWSSMGAAAADFNNDGLIDLLSADMAATTHFDAKVNMGDMSQHRWLMDNGFPRQIMRNMLYVNIGSEHFMETAFMSGVAKSDWTWAVKTADFDNDGFIDIFMSNGMARNFSDSDIPFNTGMLVGRSVWDIYKDTPAMPQKNLVFRNAGELHFEKAEDWNLGDNAMSYGAAYGDLDLDGDQDLVVINLDAPVSVYRNDLKGGNKIVFALTGTQSNKRAIGTKIEISTPRGTQTQYFNPTCGFLSNNAYAVHFGLGQHATVERVKVTWPNGSVQTFKNLAAGYRYTITESDSNGTLPLKKIQPAPHYAEVARDLGLSFKHQEAPFDDFIRQPLLPGRLSRLGPGLAWGDADGDGIEELYVGGAAGQSGMLYHRNGTGRFQTVPGPWQNDGASEDMGCLWFDADADGDLDLYVGSGGIEGEPGQAVFRDRLYLNRGKLRFTLASTGQLPEGNHSTSAVIGSDIDGDNDIDLFIGARSIPGQFPVTPRSRLLRNDSQGGTIKFTDITDTAAPGLASAGLVTGALWSDTDSDGDPDLLVATEWGHIRFFTNTNGQFTDQSETTGLVERSGWWNSLTGSDLDNDGDTDYIITNVGFNTKYGKAKHDKPSLLYYGDMDNTGKPHLVEAKPGEEGILPVRGRSCSSNAMPMLSQKFPTFRAFASADLVDIYTPNKLREALSFEATTFESGILYNDSEAGTVRFRWAPLPWIAQATPGYGVAATDANGDGIIDLFLTGNNDSREPETGLWRGAPGQFFAGAKDGSFCLQYPKVSGLITPNDNKGLALADLDSNGTPDFVVAENNGRLLAFRHQNESAHYLAVTLKGPNGNPSGIGARALMRLDDGTQRGVEQFGGSGYLSQSTSTLFFSLGSANPQELTVQWPDGKRSRIPLNANSPRRLTVSY